MNGSRAAYTRPHLKFEGSLADLTGDGNAWGKGMPLHLDGLGHQGLNHSSEGSR